MFSLDHRDSELRLLFEAAPNGMIVTNEVGIITFVNRQIEKLFGYSRGELIGRPMGAGRDLYGLRKDGTEFPVEIGLNPFRSGDRMLVVGSVIDITERKRSEEHIRHYE